MLMAVCLGAVSCAADSPCQEYTVAITNCYDEICTGMTGCGACDKYAKAMDSSASSGSVGSADEEKCKLALNEFKCADLQAYIKTSCP